MSGHHPGELLPAVKLVLHLEEGQSDGHRDTDVRQTFAVTVRWSFFTVSLEDDVVDVGQRGPDALEQQVQGLDGCGLLSRVVAAGAQRQTEVELKGGGGGETLSYTCSLTLQADYYTCDICSQEFILTLMGEMWKNSKKLSPDVSVSEASISSACRVCRSGSISPH